MLERFGHKVVQLFKLILLQKRVLFFHSPVRPLSTSILAMLALFPGVVESGLDNCTALANPPDGVIVETVEVPKQFIPPPEEEDPVTSPTQTQSQTQNSGVYNGLTEKLSSWKDKLAGTGSKTAATPTGTPGDTTDDNKTSRESSFEDLRAPTAQEMESEVTNYLDLKNKNIHTNKKHTVSLHFILFFVWNTDRNLAEFLQLSSLVYQMKIADCLFNYLEK